MTPHPVTRRGALRRAAIAAASLSAVAASVSAWNVLSPGVAGAAPVDKGAAEIVTPSGGAGAGQPLAGGGSGTGFTIKLPAGAACTKDGNNGGRAHTYMIPVSQNPAVDLTFQGNGALVGQSTGSAGAGTFRHNLYTATSQPARGTVIGLNINDAVIINIPTFDLDVFSAGQIPVGAYNVGIACVDLGEGVSGGSTYAPNNYWNTGITIAADTGDPRGIEFTVTPPTTTTTTSTSTSTTAPGGGTTSTTAAGGSTTSTTAAGETTTSTVAGSSTTLTGSSTSSSGSGGGALPSTGSDVLRLIVWALLFASFGRIAIVLGRSAPRAGHNGRVGR